MVTFLPVCEWRRCRFSTWGGNLHSRILPALWAGNFQLLADGPHRPFLDFAMARDAGDLVQRRVEPNAMRSEEHTSELQSRLHLVCRLLLEKKKNNNTSLTLIREYAGDDLCSH